MKAYGSSKLANVLFSQELAERIAKFNPSARVVSLHPGFVRTELTRYMTKDNKVYLYVMYVMGLLFGKSPVEGSQTTLYTLLEDTVNIKNGAYYDNSHVGEKNPFALDPENQKKLWRKSEELLGITFDAK